MAVVPTTRPDRREARRRGRHRECLRASRLPSAAPTPRGARARSSSAETRPVNITSSIGNFSGRRFSLKKWIVKMKTTARRASSPWITVAMLKTQPGQELREERREPEHQARAADDPHAPEDGPVVELLPVGEVVELRPRSEAEETTSCGRRTPARRAAGGRGNRAPRGSPKSFFPQRRSTIRKRCQTKVPIRIDREEPVDVAGRPDADGARETLGPWPVREEEREAGQREAEEAREEHRVHDPIGPGEAPVVDRSGGLGWWRHRSVPASIVRPVGLVPFVLRAAPWRSGEAREACGRRRSEKTPISSHFMNFAV